MGGLVIGTGISNKIIFPSCIDPIPKSIHTNILTRDYTRILWKFKIKKSNFGEWGERDIDEAELVGKDKKGAESGKEKAKRLKSKSGTKETRKDKGQR